MILILFLPPLAFILLAVSEALLKSHRHGNPFKAGDWILCLSGFLAQGLLVPLLGYWIATTLLPAFFPTYLGLVELTWWQAFLVVFIGVDFLYYWQHRCFHQIPFLWKFHICHHSSPTVNVWATARNSFFTNFLFVYILLSPPLGFLCQQPEAFLAGAMCTACLDLLKHSSLDFHSLPLLKTALPVLSKVFLLPHAHHIHHDATAGQVNFGANFILWDRLFGTADLSESYPKRYQVDAKTSTARQLLYPLI